MGSSTLHAVIGGVALAGASAIAALAFGHGLYGNAALFALVAAWALALIWRIARDQSVSPPPPPPAPALPALKVQRLTAYLDISPVPLVTLADGRLAAVNRAARRLFAASDTIADPPPGLADAIAGSRPGQPASLRIGDRPYALAVAEIAVSGGSTRIAALTDIDAELRAAEAATLRDLLQVLSHEIVNALTPIASLSRTAAQLVDDPDADAGTLRDAVETVARRAEGLQRFGDAYRSLARLPEPVPARVATRELVGDLTRLFETRWPAVRLRVDALRAPATLRADADQLTAALWALLQNAAEAVDGRAEPMVTLDIRAAPGAVEILIADSGPGIAAADADAVFRPFFTTKPQGSGVGLALARQILRGHGGELRLQPSAVGASFLATLPAD